MSVAPNVAEIVGPVKLKLLESRLQGFVSPTKQTTTTSPGSDNPPMSSPPSDNTNEKMVKEATVSTLIDEIPPSQPNKRSSPRKSPKKPPSEPPSKPTEVIVIDSDTPVHPASGSHLSAKFDKENMEAEPAHIVGAKRIRTEEDSRSQLTHDSMDQTEDRVARMKTSHEEDNQSPNQPGVDNGSRGASMPKRTIASYFATTTEQSSIFPSSAPAPATGPAPASAAAAPTSETPSTASTNKSTAGNSKAAKQTAAAAAASSSGANVAELRKQAEQARIAKEQAEQKVQRLEFEMKSTQDKSKAVEEKGLKMVKALEEVHRKMAFQEFRRKRDRLALDCVRLGKITHVRTTATAMGEVWEEGYVYKELSKRSAALLERREELEQRKRKITTMKRAARKAVGGADDDGEIGIGAGTGTGTGAGAGADDLDLTVEIEAVKYHLEQLKKDEIALNEERKLLESEKAVHQKELRRCQCEERSRFYRDLPLLHERYLLQAMLGRGGFSEVWKAMDLIELREVAVKIHQLNPTWSEERKNSYVKHVTREYNIHKDMKHARVVQLFDVFEIDVNSFATVLEYCQGIDLDEKLKRQRTIPEKDAKVILMQIMSGLRYLNNPQGAEGGAHRKTIIHFDLKPANILFDESDDVKITDFGLSKIIDEANEGTSLELTSQGAGTYWYLPPECFAKGPEPPRISSKVDVWSAGVIFYQMLYGIRPYGEGKTQENLWSENVIFNAGQVAFPNEGAKTPKVSEEAKDLIRACLTRDQSVRPDVLTVCQHPYFKSK